MHFDSAINHGVYQANKFLKQSGGDFNKYYNLRKNLYINLARKPKQQGFYKGWINRIDKIDKIRKENVLKSY